MARLGLVAPVGNAKNAELELGGPRGSIYGDDLLHLTSVHPGIAELQFGSSTARRM